MPGGDKTGPSGLGPMTGRKAGLCAGYPVPGYMNPYGWGAGMGFRGRGGGGRGWRNRFYATGLTGWQRAAFGWPPWGIMPPQFMPGFAPTAQPMTREQELDALKAQAEQFENALDHIRIQIDELQAKTDQE